MAEILLTGGALRDLAYTMYGASALYGAYLFRLYRESEAESAPFAERMRQRFGRVRKSKDSAEIDISLLSAQADETEGYSFGHAQRVAQAAVAIANRYGLPAPEIAQLELAALLHDSGHVDRDPFIKQPGALSGEQWGHIWDHPVRSQQIISQIPNAAQASLWARWHHERWDGTGYPDRLAEEDIPLPARILAVADAYDAMINDRPYRPAMTSQAAAEELMKRTGSQFDPQVVQVFLSLGSEEEV